ncbi:hypothetical protein CTI12_AA159960 [Artemisia annua]|uniref:Uncharacterized protein n=1 Tax=Artemisia annua TaxID=35608 RepID=A0A2U1P4R9_ARTAN|nr:hypothetical protein CTI12_AA159960 [Artemisia annua]
MGSSLVWDIHEYNSSALKIQKLFRGFVARKSVNKIVSIKNEVNEIKKRLLNDVAFVKLIRNDAKERLRERDDDVSNNAKNSESVLNEDGIIDEGSNDEVSKNCCEGVNEGSLNKGKMEVVMEKLMCDSAKMMKLMIQISKRNKMQTWLINSLSRRVEHVEKAFMNDKLRRKKKKMYTRREKDGFCI